MPLLEEIEIRSDDEVAAALYRVLVRQMAFDPAYALVAGSLDDLRRVTQTAVPELDPAALETRTDGPLLRALLHDIASQPELSHLVEGCFDRSRGTILQEVTPSLVLAAVVLATWPMLECSYADPARRAGLRAAVRPGSQPLDAVPRFAAAVG